MSSAMHSQAIYRAHTEFARVNQAWMELALVPINQWGKTEMTLAHAVAIALQDAYERGARGEKVTQEIPQNTAQDTPQDAPTSKRISRASKVEIDFKREMRGRA